MPDRTTELIHHPYTPPAGFDAVPVGVHRASTVLFDNVAALRARDWRSKHGYTYGLHGTPTTFTLEERIATLDGGTHCVLAPSGLAAITMANLALLQQGDEVLLPDNVYGPSRDQARGLLANLGIAHRVYDPLDAERFPSLLGERTRLVWLEAPGSVTMEFPDLRALVRAVKAHGAIAALDHTWGAGVAFDAFALGDGLQVDVSMQALTKYPSGGADVLMGSLTTRDESLHQRLMLAHMRLGIGIGANDAELVLRALPSLTLRYAAQGAAALNGSARRRPSRTCCTRRCRAPRATSTGRRCAPRPPGCSRWCSTRPSTAPASTPSSTHCACSASATHGAARSAWPCRTT
jgi:cystathionine beta-lyase